MFALKPYWINFFLLIILTITSLVYLPGLTGSFLLDDLANIAPAKLNALSSHELGKVFLHNHSGKTGRPVSIFSFALNHYFSGLSPFWFKLVNLFLHLLIGYLVYRLSYSLLRLNSLLKAQDLTTASCLISGLWLLHPLQVSTVLYAVQRMTQLSALFTLAALIYFISIRQRLVSNQTLLIRHFFLLALLMSLAVLSKENGALIPAYLLFIEFVFFYGKTHSIKQKNQLYLLLGFFSLLPLLAGSFYLWTHFDAFTQGGYLKRDFNLSQRLFTETHVLLFYLGNILAPNLNTMGLFLDDFPIALSLDLSTCLNILFISILLTICAIFRKKKPILSFGIGFFFIGHLLESTIFPLELAFEHRNYLPIFGPLLIIGYYLVQVTKQSPKGIKIVLFILILLILSFLTFLRASIWGNNQLFMQNSVENHPKSRRALIEMSRIYIQHGQVEKATHLLQKAASVSPHDAAPDIHLLGIFCTSLDQAAIQKRVAQIEQKLKHGIISIYTSNVLYGLQENKMRHNCPSVSSHQILQLSHSVINNPNFGSIGKYRFIHGRSLLLVGQFYEAEIYLIQAANTSASEFLPGILYTLGIVQLQLIKLEEVEQTIIQLKQLSVDAYLDTNRQVNDLTSRLNRIKNQK